MHEHCKMRQTILPLVTVKVTGNGNEAEPREEEKTERESFIGKMFWLAHTNW